MSRRDCGSHKWEGRQSHRSGRFYHWYRLGWGVWWWVVEWSLMMQIVSHETELASYIPVHSLGLMHLPLLSSTIPSGQKQPCTH